MEEVANEIDEIDGCHSLLKGNSTGDGNRMTEFVNSSETIAFLSILLMVVLSHTAHQFLRRASQPRIISDIIVGIFFGNIKVIRGLFSEAAFQTLNFVMDFGMMLYMFVLGLETDPCQFLRRPTTEAKLAYTGMIFTFIVACVVFMFLHMANYKTVLFTLALSLNLSGTSSPVLTRVITDLKIGKSDIGRLAIAAGTLSDFISSMIICIAWIFVHFSKTDKSCFRSLSDMLKIIAALLIQLVFVAKVSPIFMTWVNNANPEGKPIKGSHLVLSLAFMGITCSCSTIQGYNPMLSAFLTGVFLPAHGRMSKWVTGKIQYLLGLLYPVFFFWMGLLANLWKFEAAHLLTWVRLVVLLAVAIGGKVFGVVTAGAILGINWPESVALGLFLATKGHFHVYLAMVAIRVEIISVSTSIVMVFVCFVTIVYAPAIVAHIIRRARQRSHHFPTTLQWVDPSLELQILLCVHGPQNVPTTINFMEISRGTPEPGIVVYVTDVIELTEEVASKIAQSEGGVAAVAATDKSVTEMRDKISAPILAYVAERGQGIKVKRMLALNTYSGMPHDVSQLAEDFRVALIILPFHKSLRDDGTLDAGHVGIRYLNRKLLKNAPCSVGILVDRSFGIGTISPSSSEVVTVAVIFMGGKDDREALAYAGYVAIHQGVKLTVIRFLLDTESESVRRAYYRINSKEQEEEMKLDDESFADFYEKHVSVGRVDYKEKHLANSSQTYTALKSLEGMYSLVIVGRGLRTNKLLTVGMNDWQQCPELGPIGDVLSGPDFLHNTSILIIQQANLKTELDGLDADFSVL